MSVATDRVTESFRTDLLSGHDSSAGVTFEATAQVPPVAEFLAAAGFAPWPQTE